MLSILKLRYMILEYFRERFFLLVLVSILFLMGIVFGVLASNALEEEQKHVLANYIDQGLHGDVYLQNSDFYTRQTVIGNIQSIFFLFFMGISVIGVPLALLLIFTRGFILGFSAGFLFQSMGFKGFLLTLIGIVPHNLLVIPALFIMIVAIIDCASALTKIRFTKTQVPISEELIRCSFITLMVLVIMILAGLVQGYITPTITSWLSRVI